MRTIELCAYPIDIFPLINAASTTLDAAGVLYEPATATVPARYHPTAITQYALAQWNAFLTQRDEAYKAAFMAQVAWLLQNEVRIANDAASWPVPFALPTYYAPEHWLSATTQGNAISALVRAYQLTNEETYLQAAQRAVRIFEYDILDGGIAAQIGEQGIFFEEVAVYPAAHILSGHLIALLGLSDYVATTQDSKVEALFYQGMNTLHTMLDAFDTGYWTRYDQLHQRLASPVQHALHIKLLETLAHSSSCEHCTTVTARWTSYQHSWRARSHAALTSRVDMLGERLMSGLRRLLFGASERTSEPSSQQTHTRVCVPITGFPVPGGMRSVLAGVAQVIGEHWQMTYLTHHKGENKEGLDIETFGGRFAHPWQFPGVWLYSFAGWRKLFRLLRRNSGYNLILPQDGVFSGAFAALVGKMAGRRVVCMDHGTVTWLHNPQLQKERMGVLKTYRWYQWWHSRLRFACYWPSLNIMGRIAARNTDLFLVAGDEVEEVYRTLLGIHPSRIIRYAYITDVERLTPPDRETRNKLRAQQGIAEDAIVITLINRLAIVKGLDIAIEGVALALAELAPEAQARVKVLIVGDGPLRSQVEADIQRYNLASTCTMWGVANPTDVVMHLGIADIFLYSGTRGTNYSMAVLEAMGAGCAVVATTAPQSNARLLADGRGIAIPPGSAQAIGTALARLCNDPTLCRQMGHLARDYITHHHSELTLRRTLLRASFFVPSFASLRDRR